MILAQIDEAIKGVNAASNGGAQWILCAKELAVSEARTKAVEEHNRLLKAPVKEFRN